jgi:hypothetical protein
MMHDFMASLLYAKRDQVPIALSTQEVKYLMANGLVMPSIGKDRRDWRVQVQPASGGMLCVL